MKKIMFNDKYGLTAAVLNGKKTMTRRFLTQNYERVSCMNVNYEDHWHGELDGETFELIPLYKPCEIVAVAQAYKDIIGDRVFFVSSETGVSVHRSVMEREKGWTNKMNVAAEFMPHHIRITDIKVERLQDISEADCLKEGIIHKTTPVLYPCGNNVYTFEGNNGGAWYGSIQGYMTAKVAFAHLIDKVSGKGTWESNPWVFVYSFKLID